MIQNLWEHYQNLKKQRVSAIKQTQAKLKEAEKSTNAQIKQLTAAIQYQPTDVIQSLQNILMKEIRMPQRKLSNGQKNEKIEPFDHKNQVLPRTPNKIPQKSSKEIPSYKNIQQYGTKGRQIAEKDKPQFMTHKHNSMNPKHENNEQPKNQSSPVLGRQKLKRINSATRIQDTFQGQQLR